MIYIGICRFGDSIVVIEDSCHDFEAGIAKTPPFGLGRCTSKLSNFERPPIGVERQFGEEVKAQVSSSTLDRISKLRGQQ
ncbi:hypothetical protein TNCV_137801 [Trichonephila clavipes]|nr:hypothetical protein TNCV_137801 [Trichonephila clavipes]